MAIIRNALTGKTNTPKPITGESRTQQHMKDETDINNIVNRHLKGGPLGNPAATRQPIYGDYTSLDYMAMRNAIADIDQGFASLPSRIRNRFNNDVHQMIRFIEKPENMQEAIKLGLVMPEIVDDNDNFNETMPPDTAAAGTPPTPPVP